MKDNIVIIPAFPGHYSVIFEGGDLFEMPIVAWKYDLTKNYCCPIITGDCDYCCQDAIVFPDRRVHHLKSEQRWESKEEFLGYIRQNEEAWCNKY